MLERFTLIFGIIGAWLTSGTGYFVLKGLRGEKLPKGSVISEIQENNGDQAPPGTFWSRVGVSFAMTVGVGGLFVFVFLMFFLGNSGFFEMLGFEEMFDVPRFEIISLMSLAAVSAIAVIRRKKSN